ncbi:hypothetical protein N7520_009457 [Penicillium odoratum]|uniref:uncharacterized protein n=1 Tax=Penicillium odoratum TaxID=1167516 RepID=UPI0025491C0A|nr:uncharacterized protein N7520_009457 [Penicillium odoratum]KAJ5752540.1 hypothetical protein N7520_009457 [Penicillium odoratum]
MGSLQISYISEPFAILTDRLILLPTPIAVSSATYRKLYATLHADASFCQMGFGNRFPVKNWSDDETRNMIETRDIALSWTKFDLGDFAVGLRECQFNDKSPHERKSPPSVKLIKGSELEKLTGIDLAHLEEIHWVGYAGIRDATTTSLLRVREAGDPAFPPWQEMVEVRYGVSPECWGTGIAKEAMEAVIRWAVDERGVRRFIAETERENQRSGRVLQKLGFNLSGTNYFKEPLEIEWELVV